MSAEQQDLMEIPVNSSSIEALKAGRTLMAEKCADKLARNVVNLDPINSADISLTHVYDEGYWTDNLTLNAGDVMGLEALGLDDVVGDLLQPGVEDQLLAEKKLAGLDLTIKRYGRGLTYRLAPNSESKAESKRDLSPEIVAAVSQRYQSSPGHRELHKIAANYGSLAELPPKITTDAFDPTQDPLGSIAFLSDIGLVRPARILELMKSGKDFTAILQEQILNVSEYTAVKKDEPDYTLFTWGKGVKRQLAINKSTGTFQYAITRNPDDFYPELANQSPEYSVPFVETECAQQINDWLDANDLMFSPAVQRTIMDTKEADRFGSVYTQLSREVAKWVNQPSRTAVSNLFCKREPSLLGKKLIEKNYGMDDYVDEESLTDESYIKQQLTKIDFSNFGESAAVLMGMVNQAVNRETFQSQLKVTDKNIKIRDGACFDVISYYLGGAYDELGLNGQASSQVEISGVSMLEKFTGAHTFLLQEPTLFNGVTLPKGSLMAKQDDGGWAFLRLTAFAFDNPKDQEAAGGSEISKAYIHEAEAIKRIGGMTLASLWSASWTKR